MKAASARGRNYFPHPASDASPFFIYKLESLQFKVKCPRIINVPKAEYLYIFLKVLPSAYTNKSFSYKTFPVHPTIISVFHLYTKFINRGIIY